ncbi:MAG: universal stress protein [Boseongicola sp.]
MFNNILVAVDPSHVERQGRSLAAARKLADNASSEITALTVVEPLPGYMPPDLAHDAKVRSGDAAMKALRLLVGGRSEIKTIVQHGRPAHEIIAYAKAHAVDCIVIASHQPELSDYLLGSTASRVVRHSPCSVIVLR